MRIEREQVIMFVKMSSKRRLRKVRASVWSLSGRRSDRIASADRSEMYGIYKGVSGRTWEKRRKLAYSACSMSGSYSTRLEPEQGRYIRETTYGKEQTDLVRAGN